MKTTKIFFPDFDHFNYKGYKVHIETRQVIVMSNSERIIEYTEGDLVMYSQFVSDKDRLDQLDNVLNFHKEYTL